MNHINTFNWNILKQQKNHEHIFTFQIMSNFTNLRRFHKNPGNQKGPKGSHK
jgi:hypothetical protein